MKPALDARIEELDSQSEVIFETTECTAIENSAEVPVETRLPGALFAAVIAMTCCAMRIIVA